jgi:glycosyltransferase involved in cell wall biosynthesis
VRSDGFDKKRRVLIIVENLSVPFDRRVWRECQALQEAGYQVSVICPKGKETDVNGHEIIDGVSIYRYRTYQANGGFLSYILEYSTALLMTFWLMFVVLFHKGYDVIQICNPPDLLILVALPFKLIGKKIIFDQHDLSPEIYQMQKGGGDNQNLVVKILLLSEKITYLFSDIVIVVNKSCRKIALRRGNKKEQDVFIVRNGPSIQNIRNAQPNPALKEGRKYLLSYVGMMGPQEGVDIMLRAICNLATVYNREDFHVRIIGSGTVLDDMKQYAVELGIDHLVTFAGHADYRQVMEGIATADVCLCPDPKTPLNDKCSFVKVIEYMSLGQPLVAFDLEEVRNSADGAALYALPNDEIDFAQKINHLLDDPDLRISMGRLGKERVMNFLTWEHSKDSLKAAYEKIFKASNPAIQEAKR